MGSYILCQVKRAENPYYIESIGLNIYSIEELCYYICQNLPLLDATILNEGLAEWFKEELKLRRLAQKLQQLVQREFTLGEFILPVLQEINYLSNTEFRDLELKIKGLEEQPSPVRLKLKGDALVSHEKYIKAIEVYTATMALRKEANLGSQFLGSVYNNMGCAYARLFQMEEACDCFHHAYEELHTRATLKGYLYAVYMKSGEEAYEKAGEDLGIDPATRAEMDRQIASAGPVELPEHLDQALAEWTRAYHRNTGL